MSGTDIPYAILQWLIDNPWAIWVYLGAMAFAVALRAGWPDPTARPRWVIMALAVLDLLQLNPSGPLKLLVNKSQTGSVSRT